MTLQKAILAMRGSELPASERLVYLLVVDYTTLSLQSVCTASIPTLAWDSGLSINTVRRALESLVGRGCLTKTERTGESSEYRVTGRIPHPDGRGGDGSPSKDGRGGTTPPSKDGTPPSHRDTPTEAHGHSVGRGGAPMVGANKEDLFFRDPKKETSLGSHHERGGVSTREEQQAYQEVAAFYAGPLREAHGLQPLPPPTPQSFDGRTLAAGLAAGEPLLAAMQYLANGQDNRARFLREKRAALAATTIVKKAAEYAERGKAGNVVAFANASRGDHPPIAEPDWASMTDEEYAAYGAK